MIDQNKRLCGDLLRLNRRQIITRKKKEKTIFDFLTGIENWSYLFDYLTGIWLPINQLGFTFRMETKSCRIL